MCSKPHKADVPTLVSAVRKSSENRPTFHQNRPMDRHMIRVVHKHDPRGKVRRPWPADSIINAVFSDCQKYRYQLREIWDASLPLVLWLLMNPSVACMDY